MINKQIVDFLSKKKNIAQRDLIEKDLILTKILYYLSKEPEFLKNYAFKGGTCLTKFYLGYFRFSEDLDFTYLNQKIFKNKTANETRKIISAEITQTTKFLEEISTKIGLRFKADKGNDKYFEFGGGNRFLTLKLWYHSVELEKESFVKIQVNHKEKIKFKIKELDAKNLISKELEKEFSVNFPEEAKIFLSPLKIKCYDLKEILCEKVRAILTRRGVKSRDFIDVFMIERANNLQTENFEKEILEKTKDSLKNKKYVENLQEKTKNPPSYSKGEEERLLLIKLDKKFYTSFLDNFNRFINKLLKKLK